MTDSEKKKHSLRQWESAVEKSIRESIERGEFENLTGKGKPQDLGFNPFVPEEMRQAYHILENAGVAPDWIELDKEIRAEKNGLADLLTQHTRWHQERTARLITLTPDAMIAEHEHLARSRENILARYRARAEALNKAIDLFNLKAPNARMHHARIKIQDEIQKFLGVIKI